MKYKWWYCLENMKLFPILSQTKTTLDGSIQILLEADKARDQCVRKFKARGTETLALTSTRHKQKPEHLVDIATSLPRITHTCVSGTLTWPKYAP